MKTHKKIVLAAVFTSLTLMVCNAQAAASHQNAILLGMSSIEKNQRWKADNLLTFGLKYYFKPIEQNQYPVMLDDFTSQTSNFTLTHLEGEQDLSQSPATYDLSSTNLELKMVNLLNTVPIVLYLEAFNQEQQGDALTGGQKLEYSERTFGIGAYTSALSEVGLKISQADVEDSGNEYAEQISRSIYLEKVIAMGTENYLHLNAVYDYTDVYYARLIPRPDAATQTAEFTINYFFNPDFHLNGGYKLATSDDPEDEGKTVSLGFSYSFSRKLSVLAQSEQFSADNAQGDDQDTYSMAAIFRF